MSIEIKSGQIETFTQFIMTHGGAGPADAQGDEFMKNRSIFNQVHQKICETDSKLPEAASFLAKYRSSQMTDAEKWALISALALEDDPHFNAGLGASLQADGVARVSASYMESERGNFSAVVNLQSIKNSSLLAAALQDSRFRVLDYQGGMNLAGQLGIASTNIVTPERYEKWQKHQQNKSSGRYSTIGSLACDQEGHLCAITSTGGVGNETPGRIGDSPTIAGNYCSRQVAISCTGIGEQIVSLGVAHRLAVRVEDGQSLLDAAKKTASEVENRGFSLGFIVLRYKKPGHIEWVSASINSRLMWGYIKDKTFTSSQKYV